MDNMQVPEHIDLMLPAVYPIAIEINNDKSDDVKDDRMLNMRQRQMFQHKGVNADGDSQAQHIFGHIGNARTEGGDHIHIPDRITALVPSVPFFKKYQYKEGRHGNQ